MQLYEAFNETRVIERVSEFRERNGICIIWHDSSIWILFYCIIFPCGVRPLKMGPTLLIHFKVCSIVNYIHYVGQKKKKQILKFIWNHKRSWTAKVILRKKNKVGSITSYFKIHYKAAVSENSRYWCKNRYNRTMEQKRAPRNKPMYIQLAHLQHGSQEYIWGNDVE